MSESEVTRLLQAIDERGPDAYQDLLVVVQDELHAMASRQFRKERSDHTLQPTALINEAFIRLVRTEQTWKNRAHFFGAAAEAMRRILVDHARKKAAIRRGGDLARVTFHDLDIACEDADLDLLALDEALTELDKVDQRLGAVIRYRYFASLTVEETAELLAVSSATVKRDWAYARAWVLERISRFEESRA